MLRHAACCWLATVALALPIAAKETASARTARNFEAFLRAHAANGDFTGIVLITRHGKPIYRRSVGRASLAFDVPNGADTRFLVASVTKTFTAAAIALLQDQGKLKFTDGLELYLPGFAPAPKIKLWHLLAHQSGLADPDEERIAAREVNPDELLAMIAAQPLHFEPGSNSRYSNAGYVALARIVEKVSGQSFEDFLQQRIFSPLGMSGSGVLRSGAIVPRLAEGTLPGVGSAFLRPQAHDPSSLYGSGSAYSTAGDLDRWLTAIDRHTLFDISKQPYPFGWGKRSWLERKVLVQTGIANGYSSIVLTVPAEELHIVALMNTQTGFTGDEGQALLAIAEGKAVPLPARRAVPPKIPSAVLERHAGLYLWGEGKTPLHVRTEGGVLSLRWADSTSGFVLTPLSESEFLDRSSFSRIRFQEGGLVWTQDGKDTQAPRAPGDSGAGDHADAKVVPVP